MIIKEPGKIFDALKNDNKFIIYVDDCSKWKFYGGPTLNYEFCNPSIQADVCYKIKAFNAPVNAVVNTIEKIVSTHAISDEVLPLFIQIIVQGYPERKRHNTGGIDW